MLQHAITPLVFGSAKQFPRPLKKALGLWVHVFIAQPGEFLQLCPLGRVQMGRHLDCDADVQIAMTVALNIFDTFAFKPKHRTRLSARWNLDVGFAIEGGDIEFGPEGGLHKTNGHFAKQIVAIALKDGMRFDVKHNVKIAVRPSPHTGFAIA